MLQSSHVKNYGFIRSLIAILVGLPLLIPAQVATPVKVSDLYGANPVFVQVRSIPIFPDMTDNVERTVTIPAREAAERAEAQKQAELAQQAQQHSYTAQIVPQLPTGDAKTFIYMHESGNNPLAQNSGGCLGLGQACPGSKLTAVCPNLDYACEDNFFTQYMLGRYGSWENARAFWLSNSWW